MKLEKHKLNGELSTVVIIDESGISEFKNGRRVISIPFEKVKTVKLTAVLRSGRLSCICKVSSANATISFDNTVAGQADNAADLRYIVALQNVHAGIADSRVQACLLYTSPSPRDRG